jgi:chitinase
VNVKMRFLGKWSGSRWLLILLLVALISVFAPWRALLAHTNREWRRGGRPLLVGYFVESGVYDDSHYRVKDLVDNGGARVLDQINYSQGSVTNGVCSVADPNADLGTTYSAADTVSGQADDPRSPFRGYFHQLKELKQQHPHLRILISLEGKASSFVDDAQPEKRRAFVATCVDRFLRGNFAPGIHEPGVFDGFDIDWEFPRAEDAANFQALLEEFRKQMQAVRPDAHLTVAVGPVPGMQPGVDFRRLAAVVDQIGVMNYDYAGPWNGRTGFLAPLFAAPGNSQEDSIATGMQGFEAAGIPRSKLLMGLPFYGYSWTGVAAVNNGLFQEGRGVRDDRPYRYIRTLNGTFTAYRDPVSHAPWLYDGTTFWTYEDPVSVRYKASYVARQKLGGIMIWELSGDTRDAGLLHIADRSLRRPMSSKATLYAESRPSPGNTAAPEERMIPR